MREIKFKVWSKARKEWVHNMILLACIDGLPFAHFVEVNDIDKSVKHHVYNASNLDVAILQYTGLKDSKGNEIYEGDILCMDFKHSKASGNVVYCNHGFFLEVENGGIRSIYPNISEVVGNIYENPEILKQ